MQSLKQMLAEANAIVEAVSAAEAIGLLDDPSVVFVDLRDTSELQTEGSIPGSVHAHRGGLEFMIDPESPYHNPVFVSGRRLLFYCAGGGRSALAASTAQTMGLSNVAHLSGGFRAWKEARGPVAAQAQRASQ
jgi:rhodanese-related sulfurtransferase